MRRKAVYTATSRTTPPLSSISKTTENRFHRNVSSATLRHHHPSLILPPQRPIEDGLGAVLTMFEPISGSNASTVMCQLRGPSSLSLAAAARPRRSQLQAVTGGEQVDFQAT
jgi:hypothetical protein